MKRFIRYLYEYEGGKRIRNVGFVKIETGCEEATVHVQGKGLYMSGNCKLVLYLFYAENEKCIVFKQGETQLKNTVLNCQLHYTTEDTGVAENFEKIQGILFVSEDGRKFAATWDDRSVNVTLLEEWKAEVKECSPKPENPGPMDCEMVEPVPLSIRKIHPRDISMLPRCEWKLANNHFLMYGYNNYKHLVIIEKDEGWKLGVPGIYHQKEAELAATFGFGEFLPIEEAEVTLNLEERHQELPFGYWCRPVKRPMKR